MGSPECMAFDNAQQLQHTAADCGGNEAVSVISSFFMHGCDQTRQASQRNAKNNVEEMDSDGIGMKARLHSNF